MSSKLSNSFAGLGCLTPFFGIALLVYYFYQRSFLIGCILLFASFFVALAFFGFMSQIEENQKKKQRKIMQNFKPDRVDVQKLVSYSSYDLLSKIAVDEHQKKIYVWVPVTKKSKTITKAFVGMPYTIKTYDFSDLLAIQLSEDRYPIASAQRDTHYTNFLLNKIQEEETPTDQTAVRPIDKVNSMELEMIVNDNVNPKHVIRFYDKPHQPLRKDSPEYRALNKEFHKWSRLLTAIIRGTEQGVVDKGVEPSLGSSSPTIPETALNEPVAEKMTRITMDLDPNRYAFHLPAESPTPSEENPETGQDTPEQERLVEKPTSYFEQLVEKNRRQLRGDYTDE